MTASYLPTFLHPLPPGPHAPQRKPGLLLADVPFEKRPKTFVNNCDRPQTGESSTFAITAGAGAFN